MNTLKYQWISAKSLELGLISFDHLRPGLCTQVAPRARMRPGTNGSSAKRHGSNGSMGKEDWDQKKTRQEPIGIEHLGNAIQLTCDMLSQWLWARVCGWHVQSFRLTNALQLYNPWDPSSFCYSCSNQPKRLSTQSRLSLCPLDLLKLQRFNPCPNHPALMLRKYHCSIHYKVHVVPM